jgi:hypothetical protein
VKWRENPSKADNEKYHNQRSGKLNVSGISENRRGVKISAKGEKWRRRRRRRQRINNGGASRHAPLRTAAPAGA